MLNSGTVYKCIVILMVLGILICGAVIACMLLGAQTQAASFVDARLVQEVVSCAQI